MTFEWKGDGDMMGPESLDMSGMDGDMTHMKIIRKKTKVDRKKDGKQIEVKVEAEENN